mgnify:FL=1
MVLSPSQTAGTHAAIREAKPLYPRGPQLRCELCCLIPSPLLRPHVPVPRARCDFAALPLYAAPSLCGSAKATRGTFPTFTAVLSMRAIDHTPAVRCTIPLCSCSDSRLPRNRSESPPTTSVSTSNTRRTEQFRGCIVRFMLRPACLPSPPGWLRRDEVTCASPRLLRYIVIRAFHATRYQAALRIRLNGRTGNLPLPGLTPDELQQLVRLQAITG